MIIRRLFCSETFPKYFRVRQSVLTVVRNKSNVRFVKSFKNDVWKIFGQPFSIDVLCRRDVRDARCRRRRRVCDVDRRLFRSGLLQVWLQVESNSGPRKTRSVSKKIRSPEIFGGTRLGPSPRCTSTRSSCSRLATLWVGNFFRQIFEELEEWVSKFSRVCDCVSQIFASTKRCPMLFPKIDCFVRKWILRLSDWRNLYGLVIGLIHIKRLSPIPTFLLLCIFFSFREVGVYFAFI